MLYTTYFGRMKNLPEDCFKIVITRFPPQWLDANEYPAVLGLAPSEDLLHMLKHNTVTFDAFASQFTDEVLNDDNKPLAHLAKLLELRDAAIICYEKDNSKCHRRLIAEWLELHFNIKWKEI